MKEKGNLSVHIQNMSLGLMTRLKKKIYKDTFKVSIHVLKNGENYWRELIFDINRESFGLWWFKGHKSPHTKNLILICNQ